MEKNVKTHISLQCAFCRSTQFAIPHEGYRPYHGGFVVCANCWRENDFTSLFFVVKAKAADIAEQVAKDAMDDIKKQLKKAFRGNKFIKFS